LALDVPLFFGTTGSLAAFYVAAERAQGRRARDALLVVPALIGVGVGLTPLITRALLRGYRQMAGEFVRTPKRGESTDNRYRNTALVLPFAESVLFLVSLAATVASARTGHVVATPFAALFTSGYAYMAAKMIHEQIQRALPQRELKTDSALALSEALRLSEGLPLAEGLPLSEALPISDAE
jgi:hypothetical protein